MVRGEGVCCSVHVLLGVALTVRNAFFLEHEAATSRSSCF